MNPTIRDKVWDATIRIAETTSDSDERFTTGDVLEEAGLNDSHRRTAQRTLRAMEELGWLIKRSQSWEWMRVGTPTIN